MSNKTKYAAATLAASAAFFAALAAHEGYRAAPYRDSGGVPTIGIGSTQYPDGRRVKMTDPPVTQAQAVELARAHVAKDEGRLKALLPGVQLSQAEYDVYTDFVYQFGADTFAKSSIRRHLLAGNHTEACRALLKYTASPPAATAACGKTAATACGRGSNGGIASAWRQTHDLDNQTLETRPRRPRAARTVWRMAV